MTFIKKILKKLILVFANITVTFVSLFIPKSRRIVVVGGWFGERFADNSKHLYLYIHNNKNDLDISKVIWITKKKNIMDELSERGYNTYFKWSIKSIWYHFRALYHIVDQSPDDINSLFSVRSKRINLWHGFPLKKIGYYTRDMKEKKYQKINMLRKILSKGYWSDHFLLATSDFSADVLGEAFNITKDKVVISGYPRNNAVLNINSNNYVSKKEELLYREIEKFKKEGYTIIGYFPTFRDKKNTLLFGSNDSKELINFFDFCEDNRIRVVSKFHFAGKDKTMIDVNTHNALLNIDDESDVYTFISKVDLLITDYSSIYFDFLLLNRPILFFPYDLDYYTNEDRGLIFNYNEYTPGEKVFSLMELQSILSQNINKITEDYAKNYGKDNENLKCKIFGEYKEMNISDLIYKIRNI